jgi:prevent-host-death family protein
MTEYTVQEAAAKLEEILQKVRGGEMVILTDNGTDIAVIRPIPHMVRTGAPDEDVLRELIAEGIIIPSTEPRGKLEPVVVDPGALARFLDSRD